MDVANCTEHVIQSSTFASYDISRWLTENLVYVDMHGCPADVPDVERFCGDFLAVLCTTAGLDVSAPDEQVESVMAQMTRGDEDAPRKIGIIMSVNLNIKAAPYAESITRWIESESTQLRTRAFLLGTAVIVRNKLFREVANQVLTRSKGTAPRKAFENEESAVAWLRELAQS